MMMVMMVTRIEESPSVDCSPPESIAVVIRSHLHGDPHCGALSQRAVHFAQWFTVYIVRSQWFTVYTVHCVANCTVHCGSWTVCSNVKIPKCTFTAGFCTKTRAISMPCIVCVSDIFFVLNCVSIPQLAAHAPTHNTQRYTHIFFTYHFYTH